MPLMESKGTNAPVWCDAIGLPWGVDAPEAIEYASKPHDDCVSLQPLQQLSLRSWRTPKPDIGDPSGEFCGGPP